jgi:RNA ligase (TIGR02306 family)
MSQLIVEICKVNEVSAHPNADKLDIIKVKGWQCIVSRNQYKIDDLVIYCPPDTIVPQNLVEQYKLEFLRKNGRVGSIKLRGALSQGLVLDVPNYLPFPQEGKDIAEVMGFTKYEVPEPEYSIKTGQPHKKKVSNPLFDKYTDIENINNFDTILEEGETVIITEKIHGCNARYANLPKSTNHIFQWLGAKLFGSHEFVYGSRTVQKKWTNIHKGYYKEDVWGKIARRYKINEWLPKDYIIYGEIYGDKIQDLTYGLKNDIEFRIFDIKYKGKFVEVGEYSHTLNKFCLLAKEKCGLELQVVPLLYFGQYHNELKEKYSKGFSQLCPTQIREGCVIKPVQEREHYKLGRVILKVINPEYYERSKGTEFR